MSSVHLGTPHLHVTAAELHTGRDDGLLLLRAFPSALGGSWCVVPILDKTSCEGRGGVPRGGGGGPGQDGWDRLSSALASARRRLRACRGRAQAKPTGPGCSCVVCSHRSMGRFGQRAVQSVPRNLELAMSGGSAGSHSGRIGRGGSCRKTRYSNGSAGGTGSLVWRDRTIPSLSHMTKQSHDFRSLSHCVRGPLCPQPPASDRPLQPHGTIAAAAISRHSGRSPYRHWEAEGRAVPLSSHLPRGERLSLSSQAAPPL
eukprot:scaffold3348_cov113-Isochrysis_galbana.AAC.21